MLKLISILLTGIAICSATVNVPNSTLFLDELQSSNNIYTENKPFPSIIQSVIYVNNLNKRIVGLARKSVAKDKLDSIVSNNYKYMFMYASNGYLDSQVIFNKSTKVSTKTEIVSDLQGNILTRSIYSKEDTSVVWSKTGQEEYTYNTQGKILSVITNTWFSSNEVYTTKGDYVYDSRNLVKTINYSSRKTSTSIFENSMCTDEYVYDDNDNLLSAVLSLWNDVSLKFDKNEKIIYTYGVNGLVATARNYLFNLANSTWIENSKCSYNFDEKGSFNSVTISNLDTLTSTLKEKTKEEFYFSDLESGDLLFPPSITLLGNMSQNRKIIKTISYIFVNANNLTATDTNDYYYSPLNTAITRNEKQSLQKSELTLLNMGSTARILNSSKNILRFGLYSLHGRLLQGYTIKNILDIDMSNLPRGHFFIKYKNDTNQVKILVLINK